MTAAGEALPCTLIFDYLLYFFDFDGIIIFPITTVIEDALLLLTV